MSESIFAPKRVVAVNRFSVDNAIDLEKTSLLQYALSRSEDDLHFKPGVAPTWFHIARLPRRFVVDVLASYPEAMSLQRNAQACRVALQRIELPDGTEMRPEKVEPGKFGTTLADEAWIDQVAELFGDAVLDEMGQVAWDLRQMKPGQAGPFVLPFGLGVRR